MNEKNTDAIDVLKKLISIDSINNERGGKKDAEYEIGQYLTAYLKRIGCNVMLQHVRDNVSNVIGIIEIDKNYPSRIFCAHMDTVNIEGMTANPFDAVINEGRIYGRGACDTKASLAAMLTAFSRYVSDSRRFNNIAVLFTVDEESGKAGVKKFCGEFMKENFKDIEGVVVGEPTEMKIVSAHGGCVRFSIETGGIACHSSTPQLGESAILNMTKVIEKLEKEYKPSLSTRWHPLTGKAVCNVTRIQGGKEINIIPDNCVIHIDRRVVPGEDSDAVYKEIAAFLESEMQSCRCKVNPPMLVDYPLYNSDDCRFLQKVQAVFNALNWPSQPCGLMMGTEASDFSRIGVPALVIGPGSINQAHSNDEWVSLEHLQWAQDAYLELMLAH
jgi:acetylornithine deacetylase/succinyl-diaminopimelate desuccinylase family protein